MSAELLTLIALWCADDGRGHHTAQTCLIRTAQCAAALPGKGNQAVKRKCLPQRKSA